MIFIIQLGGNSHVGMQILHTQKCIPTKQYQQKHFLQKWYSGSATSGLVCHSTEQIYKE